MSDITRSGWTPQTYLEFERGSEIRHEYYNGQIYAMSGASEKHNTLTSTLNGIFYNQLRKRPCKVYTSDMRVSISAHDHYTYPDVIVVCGKPQLEDKQLDTLLNPTLIIEVLSSSTEKYDRGLKFLHYRSIPSLQEYLLVSQKTISIEHYTRQVDGWLLREANTLEQTLNLSSIDCQLSLAEVYEKVEF